MNENKPNQSLATISLVLGILSVTLCWILAAIPAVITGHMALGRVRRTPNEYGGKSLATAGLIMGYIGLAVTIAVGGLALAMMPALSQAQEKAQSIHCINNMKQIGLAFRIFATDNNDLFPFNISTNQGGTFELCSRDADGFVSRATVFRGN